MPDFFIRRPIFAWVVALLISLIGLLAIPSLPIAQYPDIAPPVITLRTTYPGASAQDTEEAVTAVIEKEINGAPGLMYMSATSSSDGAVEIAATFTQGTDPDIAAVEVQNRLKIVESRLPESVRKEGVFVEKSSNNIQAMISLSSTGNLNDTELGEWASARIIPELKRVKGVGRVELFGAETSMRIWPDPEKLEALGLTPTDIVNAVAAQSERIIIGDIGGAAVSKSAPINASVVAEEAFRTPEEIRLHCAENAFRRFLRQAGGRGAGGAGLQQLRVLLPLQRADRHRHGYQDGSRLQRRGNHGPAQGQDG